MTTNGKSSSEKNPEGVRRIKDGVEVPPRSKRKKYYDLFPKPHDLEGRLIREK